MRLDLLVAALLCIPPQDGADAMPLSAPLGRAPKCGTPHPQHANLLCTRPHGHQGEHKVASVTWEGPAAVEEEPAALHRWASTVDAPIRAPALDDEVMELLLRDAQLADTRPNRQMAREQERRERERSRSRLAEAQEQVDAQAKEATRAKGQQAAMARHKADAEARRAKRAAKLAERAGRTRDE